MPDIKIIINGTEIDPSTKADIADVVIKRSLSASDSFSVRLRGRHTTYLDSDLFPFGAKVEILIGYVGDLKKAIEGEVTAWYSELTEHGTWFVFRGMDRSHRLRRGTRHRSLEQLSDAELAENVASDHGLKGQADPTSWKPAISTQLGASDYTFFHDRTRRLGYRDHTWESTLHFVVPTYEDSGLKFKFEYDIQTLDLVTEMSDVPTAVKVMGWDMQGKKEVLAEARPGDELWAARNLHFGPKMSEKAFGEGVHILPDLNPFDPDEAKAIAIGYFQDRSQLVMQGPLTVRGNQYAEIGKLVTLEGVGDALGGSHLVSALTHYFSDHGFFTRLELCSNCWPVGASSSSESGGNPGGGPPGASTGVPTGAPTGGPTGVPTGIQTGGPIGGPTGAPTGIQTGGPTGGPTGAPTGTQTGGPTGGPTGVPTGMQTSGPTGGPTGTLTGGPTGGGTGPHVPPRKSLALTAIIGKVTSADWVTHHHATLFAELTIKGEIKDVKVTASPFSSWPDYPMVTGIWQTNLNGDWKVIKKMIKGVVGDSHSADRPCKVPGGPHGNGWSQIWGPYNKNKGWFVLNGLGEGRYVIAVYARNSGVITLTVQGIGADDKYKSSVILIHQGPHPSPGD